MEAKTKVYSRFRHPARVNLNKRYKARKEGGLKGEKGRAQLCCTGLPTTQCAKIIRHNIILCAYIKA
jgi:hypothetical protein